MDCRRKKGRASVKAGARFICLRQPLALPVDKMLIAMNQNVLFALMKVKIMSDNVKMRSRLAR